MIKKLLLIGSLITSSLTSVCGAEDVFNTFAWQPNCFTVTNGFLNPISVKHIVSLPKICANFKKKDIHENYCCGGNRANLSLCHLLWQLTRLGVQYARKIDTKKIFFINVKYYSFDYGLHNYFVCDGEKRFWEKMSGSESQAEHICIFDRINCVSVHGGMEHKYVCRSNYALYHSWAVGVSFPIGVPDIILIYTPLVFYHKNGFYARLHLIQFSISNLISAIMYHYDAVCDSSNEKISNQDLSIKKITEYYGSIPKFYFSFIGKSLLYNITLECGYCVAFSSKKVSNNVLW